MKKGKIIGKRQIVMASLILVLAGAVWLNMTLDSKTGTKSAASSSSQKSLGDAEYVNAGVKDENSYFKKVRDDREKTRKKELELLNDTVDSAKSDDNAKSEASDRILVISKRMEDEQSVEDLIKAKGFSECVAVISDDGVSVVVSCEALSDSETVQIQDIVVSQTSCGLEKIKILTY